MSPCPGTIATKRRLKLRDLDILMAVIETGSMGKAANRLDISQPAVSKAIVELEDALGVQLFDRGRRGVVPTPYGLALRKRGVSIFNDLRQGVQDIDFLSDPTKGEIRIGDDRADHGGHLVAGDRSAVAQISADVLSHRRGRHGVLYREVAERNIDLAICRMIGKLPDELAAEVLFHNSVAVMTTADNPLTRRRKLKLADLMNEPWAAVPLRKLLWRGHCRYFPRERPRAAEADSLHLVDSRPERIARDRPFSHGAAELHAAVQWPNLPLKALPWRYPTRRCRSDSSP